MLKKHIKCSKASFALNSIKKNQKIGTYRVVYDQELIGEYDLLASNDVQKVNIFTRLWPF